MRERFDLISRVIGADLEEGRLEKRRSFDYRRRSPQKSTMEERHGDHKNTVFPMADLTKSPYS